MSGHRGLAGRVLRSVALIASLVLLAGCGFKGAYSLPLPGGAAHGKTYTVMAQFDDVQDLVPQNAVRVNDVAVGDITKIDMGKNTQGRIVADVTMKINANVHLPKNAVATLSQTTLLGEKYVALSSPTSPQGTLGNGDQIQEASTSDLPTVEDVFGILSNVLNGGSLQDLQTINVQVTKALSGREQQVRDALNQLNTFVGGLDTQKAQIVRALDELNRFSHGLAVQTGTINTALEDLPPGLKVLADERAQFTDLLTKLSTFGRVATHVITASKNDTIADLRDLQPVLGHLAAAGSNLPHALEILITFPFPKGFTNSAPGDYAGLRLTFDADPLFCAILKPLKIAPTTCGKTGDLPPIPLTKKKSTTTQKKKTGSGSKKGGGLGGIVKKVLPTPPPLPTPTPSNLGGLLGGLSGGTS